jgi:hypothetical protein
MKFTFASSFKTAALLAAVGPFLAGAMIGLRNGTSLAITMALGLPLVALGAAVLTTPALYLGSAVLKQGFSAPMVAAAVGQGLAALGLALLGLAPLQLLLAATMTTATGASLAGGALLVFASLVALRRVVLELPGPRSFARVGLFGAWGVITMIIATRLTLETLTVGGGL